MRLVEKIRPPVDGRKWKKEYAKKGEKINQHYSQKPNHAERSVRNDPHKRSKRRGNY